MKNKEKIFAVAPMMDWTDRHCRYFHRLLTKRALLYTEMVVADALIHGDVPRHLDFDESEHPIALQIGGSEPEKLMKAAKIGAEWGYDEINLNVGCPSDRVQSGAFGACLMKEPELVARCVGAMKEAVDIPITVKCRIGVDDQDPEPALDAMASGVFAEGCDGLWVHARKAWLQGLSPKENRDIPPLDYDRVMRLKAKFPNNFIGINGGVNNLDKACLLMDKLDGVMMGRAAYHEPFLLAGVDRQVFGEPAQDVERATVVESLKPYVDRQLAAGRRLPQISRPLLGLFHSQPGARLWRRYLAENAHLPGANFTTLRKALGFVC